MCNWVGKDPRADSWPDLDPEARYVAFNSDVAEMIVVDKAAACSGRYYLEGQAG